MADGIAAACGTIPPGASFEALGITEAVRIMDENSRPAGRAGTWWTAEVEWPDGTTVVSGPNSPGEPCGRGIVARWLETRCREREQRLTRITLTPHAVELG